MWRHLREEPCRFTLLLLAYICLPSAVEGVKVEINRRRSAEAGPTTGDVRTSKVNRRFQTQINPDLLKSSEASSPTFPSGLWSLLVMCCSLCEEKELFLKEFWKQPPKFCINIAHNTRTNCFAPIITVQERRTAPFGTCFFFESMFWVF